MLCDRSWYNGAGVEPAMDFCSKEEYQKFLRACPLFEEILTRSEIILVKYWFSVSEWEQERRFEERVETPIKRWKLSPMDLKSRERWIEYSCAKDAMQSHTDSKLSPRYVVDANNKKKTHLNCIAHLFSQMPYKAVAREVNMVSPRQEDSSYVQPLLESQRCAPAIY